MANILWQGLVCAVLTLFLGCSSLKKRVVGAYLKGFQDTKARAVMVSPPPSPYERQDHLVLDTLWWNPKAGSSISYFSSCSKIQKSLKEFQKNSFPQNSKYKILKIVTSEAGLYSILELSSSNREKAYTGIHTMKKGSCWFNINLVTSSKASFKAEEPIFKQFIKEFALR